MSDYLTVEDKRLINQHMSEVGVTVCPPCRFSDNVVSLLGGGRKSEQARRRAAQRQRRFARFCGERRKPVPSLSTSRMIELAKTKTAREMHLG